MKRAFCISLATLCYFSIHVNGAFADVLFESGTLGPTGVSWMDLQAQSTPGTNISTFAYNGVRFEFTQPVLTDKIGGHFVAATEGTFFGAIVELNGASDFPNSGDLSTPDVVGHALLAFPSSSAEVFSDLKLALTPGWYALVFGSGLFGATTDGGAVRNGMDIGNPSYIAFQPSSAFGWVNITTFPNHRFVVKGVVVPEPGVLALVSITLPSILFLALRIRR